MKEKANVTCQVSISDVSLCYFLGQFLAANSFCILSLFIVFYMFLVLSRFTLYFLSGSPNFWHTYKTRRNLELLEQRQIFTTERQSIELHEPVKKTLLLADQHIQLLAENRSRSVQKYSR